MKKQRIYEIIFEADTRAGKAFDVGLLVTIIASIVVVMLESVDVLRSGRERLFLVLEWLFTGLFTVEYLLRVYCVRHPSRYVFSFFGIVDFLAILPAYLSLVLGGAQTLVVVRVLRLLRVFRVFKLARFLGAADVLARAIRSSVPKLVVFTITVMTAVVIVGTAMYLIEGPHNAAFDDIPRSMYWAIVTMTTVGYGDIVPTTVPGRVVAAGLMLLGFAILAVPTGIMAAEMMVSMRRSISTQVCPECLAEDHESHAIHCKMCGAELNPQALD